ncbi:acyl-CoA-binding domain-containing protein 4 isoform X1 [Cajanus cajan]|uniref:acyl-CoA-binding domain-containing protein 4 isoform X1 n=1 Tax=Cajanus cajan TaxID=3821 RepID=UPI00098DD2C4|nr:acyl-CoA-binding domain-containing protein 4 isoform X1 [Cajanus cajan]
MSSVVPQVSKNKAMWLHPKVLGFNPSERWGHSACFSNSLMYVFGGCCGGLHFCDVLTLDLNKMVWSKLTTTGEKPGPRDSHSAVLVGHKMIVFGGTNGFKKVNHVHILDLVTKEWVRPEVKGTPPSPRESHTATLVGDERIVIFGGSGEGHANYLNDLHILDLRTMSWTSPELKGDLPVPRDSHSTLAIGDKLIVYGGDSGDQYHGNVHMLDMATMTWSRLTIQGSPPGVRAGHAAVNIGTKVYIIGGVGDKRYYNDVWIFDICNFSWTQLDIPFQQPQGRFSHTAVVAGIDIVIYGGCGEDERPLKELLVLQLGAEHPNGRYYIHMCKPFGTYITRENKIIPGEADTNSKLVRNNVEAFGKGAYEVASEKALPCLFDSGASRQKRRRIAASKVWDVESEQEEKFLSLSLHSSPYQSDQEQTPTQKTNTLFPTTCQHDNDSDDKRTPLKTPRDFHFREHKLKQQQSLYVHEDRKRAQHQAAEQKAMGRGPIQHMIGAEVRGRVNGAFDSGALSPVNGKVFRGVIFAPGTGIVSKVASVQPNCSLTSSLPSTQAFLNSNHVSNLRASQHAPICLHAEPCHVSRQTPVALPFPIMRGSPNGVSKEHKIRGDLQGLVLTLGGPTSGNPQVKY